MALIGPMSGSLTRLESGSPAWISGNGLSITSGSDGSVTFTAVQQINLANFGDRSDGDVTLVTGGVGAPAWTTYSSDIYTMNRDAFLNNLTVNSGVSFRPQGFLPYIAGTLVNSGTVECRGADASGVTGGAAVTDAGTFIADTTGGGNGAGSTGNTTGGNSTLLANSAGGSGGAGGTGNAIAAGVPGTASAPVASITSWRTLNYVLSQRLISATTILGLNGGTGGSAGGASGNGVGNTATSGGGGAGAVNLFLIMNTLDNAGTIRSRGGNGANASVVGTAFGAGGGGGGGAGAVLIAVNKVLALGTISSTGGTAGTGAGTSTAASAGGVGPVIILSGSL